MHLPCPQCKAEVSLRNIPGPCPRCGEKLYFYDRWRWPRAIACGAIALTPMFFGYHFDGTLVLWLKWLAFVWVFWFVLFFFVSYRVVSPELARAPQDGTVRLGI